MKPDYSLQLIITGHIYHDAYLASRDIKARAECAEREEAGNYKGEIYDPAQCTYMCICNDNVSNHALYQEMYEL